MPSQQLKKLADELTKALGLWSDLVDTAKVVTWPSSGDLQDIVDSSAAWQELHFTLEDLREQAKEVEKLAKEIDDELSLLTGRMRAADPDVLADESLVVFLGAAVPERRYELVYEIQKLTTLSERIRAEGKFAASPAWNTQLTKIQHTVERGLEGCQWQYDEATQGLQVDRGNTPSPSPSPTPAPQAARPPEPEPEPRPEPREHPHEADEAKSADEDEVAGTAAVEQLIEAVEEVEEAVTTAAAPTSGDSDARVEEDVLDGM